jgi:hypothetical protein
MTLQVGICQNNWIILIPLIIPELEFIVTPIVGKIGHSPEKQ